MELLLELLYKTLLNIDKIAFVIVLVGFSYLYGMATGELKAERAYKNRAHSNEKQAHS